jgi:hypothetical protein
MRIVTAHAERGTSRTAFENGYRDEAFKVFDDRPARRDADGSSGRSRAIQEADRGYGNLGTPHPGLAKARRLRSADFNRSAGSRPRDLR